MDDVVRDAVMMGVAAIQPVVATRTDIALGTLARSRKRSRWERIAIASAKQCGRATVPPVLEPCAWPDVLAKLASRTLPAPGIMLVEPSASIQARGLGDLAVTRPSEATIAIGPEGGWTPAEVLAGASQCRLVTMGPRTIRADAMAVVAVAALFAVWKEY
jgi:16S rRNA (uracil1498-N3)-methyltransferase